MRQFPMKRETTRSLVTQLAAPPRNIAATVKYRGICAFQSSLRCLAIGEIKFISKTYHTRTLAIFSGMMFDMSYTYPPLLSHFRFLKWNMQAMREGAGT